MLNVFDQSTKINRNFDGYVYYPLLKDWIFFNYFDNRAPDDCVQYFTGTSGAFTSFNYMANTPQVLQSLNYKICFRQEEGALRSFNAVVVGFNEFLE